MKALIYKDKTFAYKDIAIPIPRRDEIVIKVIHTSLNAGDYRLVQVNAGLPKSGILGSAIAGVVESIGSGINCFVIGDRVVVDTSDAGFGGLAEYAIAKAISAVSIPDSVSFIDASACPVASTTALQALTTFKLINQSDKILVVGASGGVGTFAIQLAKQLGAQVTAVCSTQNIDLVKQLGADIVINYKKDDLYSLHETFDLILAINGVYPLFLYRKLLNEEGVYVMVGGPIKQFIKNMILCPIYSLGKKKFRILNSKSKPDDLNQIMKLVSEHKLNPCIEKTYPFNETIEAFNRFEKGHSSGKIVINMSNE